MLKSPITIKLFIIVILATTSFFILPRNFSIPIIDNQASAYFSVSIKEALASYAVVRVIDAVTTIIENSKTDIGILGNGENVATGEAVAPLDNIINNLSNIFLTSIIALNVEEMAYEIGKHFTPKVLGILLFILIPLILFRLNTASTLILDIIIFILIVRFFLPLSGIINNYLYTNYFTTKIESIKTDLQNLSSGFKDLREISDFPRFEYHGLLSSIKDIANYLKDLSIFVAKKTKEFSISTFNVIKNSPQIINDLIKLSAIYVAIFVIQVIILPLGTFWMMIYLIRELIYVKLNTRNLTTVTVKSK